MPTAVELPANFRSIAEFSNAVDSGLSSVSSGIQAAQTAGLSKIADSLESFTRCLPPLGSSPQPLHSISDAGAVASPDVYLNQARDFGEHALKSFSDLAPMNEVLTKLTDPNLNQQNSLKSFGDLLGKLDFNRGFMPHLPGDAQSDKPIDSGFIPHLPGDAQAYKPIDSGFTPHLPGDAESWKPTDSGFTPQLPEDVIGDKWTPTDTGFTKIAGETIGDKWTPTDTGFTPKIVGETIGDKWVPGDSGFTPKTDESLLGDIDPGFAPDLQRLSDFQNTLQQILDLSGGMPKF